MLRVELPAAKPGMTLALPVRHPGAPTQVLLKTGYQLERDTISRMRDLGVRTVWVRCPSLEHLEKFVSPQVAEAQGEMLHDLGQCLSEAQRLATPRINYSTYTASVGQMISGLVENPKAAIFLGDIVDADDAGMLRHSSTVAYLSLMLGLKLEGYLVQERKHIPPQRAKEVESLGIGAMLHDVGMTRLSVEARARWQATGDRDDPEWREHPALGYEMVRGSVQPTAATIVLHHHQRWDGSGFAGAGQPILRDQRIHVFTRIVAVADLFDRLRYPVAGEPRPTVQALRMISSHVILPTLDPRVVTALFSVVPPYPPGSVVRLSNGNWAVVVDHNRTNPCRPSVMLIDDPARPDSAIGDPLDLAQCGFGLHVTHCDGFHTAAFNFDPPAFLREQSLAAAWS